MARITLTALDILVAIDTLKGSFSICDATGMYFGYTVEKRKAVLNRMANVLESIQMEVKNDALPVSP